MPTELAAGLPLPVEKLVPLHDEAPGNDHDSVLPCPCVIEVGLAPKVPTVSVAELFAVPPAPVHETL